MTAPTQQQDDNKMTAAKALFIGFFAAALGWAGVLVAAVAVATEQTWSKGRPERDRAAERRASWLDTQRDWLAADHAQRMRRAAANRDWLKSGANPDSRPARPGRARKFGTGLRRAVANVAVAGADFAGGFRSGWQQADTRRRQGASFLEILGTRPHTAQPQPGDSTGDQTKPGPGEPPTPATAQILQTGDHWAWTCHTPNCPGKGFDYPSREAAEAASREHQCQLDQATASDPVPDPATNPPSPTAEGEPMPADTTDTNRTNPTPHASAQAAGDSNATVLAGKLATVGTVVGGLSEGTDDLNTIVNTLNQRITAAWDLAHTQGMPTAAATAVDEARHAATLISGRLDDFSTATTAATEQLTAAVNGVNAVHRAEETLRRAGADGRALDTTAV